MTIRGRSERLYAFYILFIRLIEGIIIKSAIIKDSKISSLYETVVKDERVIF